MEKYQMDHIKINISKLVDLTICSSTFLVQFQAEGVLTSSEIAALTNIGNVYDRATQFYEIIQKRSNSYILLKRALKGTSQTGVLAILEEVNDHNSSTPFKNYGTISYSKDMFLGCGSLNSKVYQGKFENKRDVVVKKISIDEVDVEKALQEAEILIKLDDHINVIRYFKAEVTNDSVLIAMELCQNNLYCWVTKSADFDISAMDIIKQVTEGVCYLHSHQIVHGDLKPFNILLSRPGFGKVVVKIVDFGMSNIVKDGPAKLSMHTMGVGSEGLMAPEVARGYLIENPEASGSSSMSFAGDVFSLGCIYYFVLTEGMNPFGENQFQRQANILDGKVESLSEDKVTGIELGVSGFIRLIGEMVAHNHADRPAVTDILKHLSALENGEVLENGEALENGGVLENCEALEDVVWEESMLYDITEI